MSPWKGRQLTFHQTFLDAFHPPIALSIIPDGNLDKAAIDWILESIPKDYPGVGIHPAFTKNGVLDAIAISTAKRALLITQIRKPFKNQKSNATLPGRNYLHSSLFYAKHFIYAFNASDLVLSIHRDMQLTCRNVVDILSMPPAESRDIEQVIHYIIGTEARIFENLHNAFRETSFDEKQPQFIVQKAWLAHLLGYESNANHFSDFSNIAPVDTSEFTKEELDMLSDSTRGATVLGIARPGSTTTSLSSYTMTKGGKLHFQQESYNDRIRKSARQIRLNAGTGKDKIALPGQLNNVDGKSVALTLTGPGASILTEQQVSSVTVVEKRVHTQAERLDSSTVLNVLQRKQALSDNAWINRLFFSGGSEDSPVAIPDELEETGVESWESQYVSADSSSAVFVQSSEDAAGGAQSADSKLDDDDPWSNPSPAHWSSGDVDCHSGTGTGVSTPVNARKGKGPKVDALTKELEKIKIKPTRTKSTNPVAPIPDVVYSGPLNDSQLQAVNHMLDENKDVTVIKGPPGTGKTTVIAAFVSTILATSRKCIWITAETNVGVKNIATKLVQAGIYNWKLLISSEFNDWFRHMYAQLPTTNIIPSAGFGNKAKLLRGCQIVLCTKSMLANAKIAANGITKIVPIETLVIDEASQIPMGGYIGILSKFADTLKKICFIGDDMQLPPYGSDRTEALNSVFQRPHLLDDLVLLNIQYRMPPPIAKFISSQMYESSLDSWKDHPVKHSKSCQFFDVANGFEYMEDTSFINRKEAEAVITIAKNIVSKEKDFKIITPYEAQRSLLEKLLKENELPWADNIFNVDSFQGHEADYIIISTVRTSYIGFLADERRTNVMLTRAKVGMYICTKKDFLEVSAKETLVGKMGRAWEKIQGGWVTSEQMIQGDYHIE